MRAPVGSGGHKGHPFPPYPAGCTSTNQYVSLENALSPSVDNLGVSLGLAFYCISLSNDANEIHTKFSRWIFGCKKVSFNLPPCQGIFCFWNSTTPYCALLLRHHHVCNNTTHHNTNLSEGHLVRQQRSKAKALSSKTSSSESLSYEGLSTGASAESDSTKTGSWIIQHDDYGAPYW